VQQGGVFVVAAGGVVGFVDDEEVGAPGGAEQRLADVSGGAVGGDDQPPPRPGFSEPGGDRVRVGGGDGRQVGGDDGRVGDVVVAADGEHIAAGVLPGVQGLGDERDGRAGHDDDAVGRTRPQRHVRRRDGLAGPARRDDLATPTGRQRR
jgi:hypothetical protein